MTSALDLNELKQLLAETEAFSALSVEELDKCASLLELVHYSLGQLVCQAGDEADAFYIVYSGRARVVAEPGEPSATTALVFAIRPLLRGEPAMAGERPPANGGK